MTAWGAGCRVAPLGAFSQEFDFNPVIMKAARRRGRCGGGLLVAIVKA
jgi:hypothetical protein